MPDGLAEGIELGWIFMGKNDLFSSQPCLSGFSATRNLPFGGRGPVLSWGVASIGRYLPFGAHILSFLAKRIKGEYLNYSAKLYRGARGVRSQPQARFSIR